MLLRAQTHQQCTRHGGGYTYRSEGFTHTGLFHPWARWGGGPVAGNKSVPLSRGPLPYPAPHLLHTYPPPCLVHCWCVWALSNNLLHQCSILILIWMVLGVLDCPLRSPAPPYLCSSPRLTPLDFATVFQCSFLAPISPKWWPKVSIVRISEPKRLHFGSHFGDLFGPGCKSEN